MARPAGFEPATPGLEVGSDKHEPGPADVENGLKGLSNRPANERLLFPSLAWLIPKQSRQRASKPVRSRLVGIGGAFESQKGGKLRPIHRRRDCWPGFEGEPAPARLT